MAGHRRNGEGSIYQRSTDKRWIGAVTLGYDANGKQRRKVVSAKTRAEVFQKLKTLQRQIDDGLPAPDTALTVSQLLTRWYEDVLRHQVSMSAASNYKSVADHHIVPSLGRKKIVNLTPSDVDRLLSEKLDSGLSPSTVRRIRAVLSQALSQGIRWGIVVRNVAALSHSPKIPRAKVEHSLRSRPAPSWTL